MARKKRNDLTQASGITADLVAQLGTYYSAQRLRTVQTGLTVASRELRTLTQIGSLEGRLGERLTPEQRELLNNAAALLDSIKYNVEHAKERKARDEKALEKKRKLWERQAEHLVKTHFELPSDTVAQQVRILELCLLTSEVFGHAYHFKDHLSLRRMMQAEPPKWSQLSVSDWRRSEASSLLADIRYAVRGHLSSNLDITPDKQLAELNLNFEARRAGVLAQPQAVETIRIWTEALEGAAFIKSVMPTGRASG